MKVTRLVQPLLAKQQKVFMSRLLVLVLACSTSWPSPARAACLQKMYSSCQQAYLDCQLQQPTQNSDAICGCSALYYGVCLPAAGCASEYMTECVSERMKWDCLDMSVCGNKCVSAEAGLLPDDTIILPLNNFGANYLQIKVCDKGVAMEQLVKYNQVSMQRCEEADFAACNWWVPPRTFTAVAISPTSSYLQIEQCVYDEDSSASRCLESGTSEYYGTAVLWPSSIDIAYSNATLCELHSDCPGSFCDPQQLPATCAPKVSQHFEESGEGFNDERWRFDPSEL